MTSITIPTSVTSIGNATFRGCRGLTNITIPSSVTSIGESAFSDCSGLLSITIPSGVTKIYYSTFSGCSSLTSITIPTSVTSISWGAFSGCSSLESVYVNWETPISIDTSYNPFMGIDKKVCTLYVPRGTCDEYFLSDWGNCFNNIVEYDATAINRVTTNKDGKEISRYSVDGQRLDAPIKGLNIVKYSDGSVKKFVVR